MNCSLGNTITNHTCHNNIQWFCLLFLSHMILTRSSTFCCWKSTCKNQKTIAKERKYMNTLYSIDILSPYLPIQMTWSELCRNQGRLHWLFPHQISTIDKVYSTLDNGSVLYPYHVPGLAAFPPAHPPATQNRALSFWPWSTLVMDDSISEACCGNGALALTSILCCAAAFSTRSMLVTD